MPRKSDARERMIGSGVELFRRRGLHGTTFADVLAHSGAPRGSVYHHFPGGKEQFSEEVIAYAGVLMADGLEGLLREHAPDEALRLFISDWSDMLVASDFESGCPVLAATVEGAGAGAAGNIASDAFDRWEGLIDASLGDAGVPAARAQTLSTTIIAAIEGAVVLCRAAHSVGPLERVGGLMSEMLSAELAAVQPPSH